MSILKNREWYYLIFIMILNGLASAGLTSQDPVYRVLFAVAAVFFCLKILATTFSLKEYIFMVIILILLGVCFLRNHEKTLILSVMGILGCKGISVKKILTYNLYLKIGLTIFAVSFALIGIVENEPIALPKGGEIFNLYCFGYYSPNALFANLFLICLMIVAVYQGSVKLWGYIGMTAGLYLAYKILMCRTGLVVWLLFLLMVLGYWILRNSKLKRGYLFLFILIPLLCCVATFITAVLYGRGNRAAVWLDGLLTGRIKHIAPFLLGSQSFTILGNVPREPFDSIYMHLYYNYGVILFAIGIMAYIAAMYRLWKKSKDFPLMILGIMSVYGFMEQFPLNVTWNLFLLYIGAALFEKNERIYGRKQEKSDAAVL